MNKFENYIISPLCNNKVKSTIGLFIGENKVFSNYMEQLENTKVIFKDGMENYKLSIQEDKVSKFKYICLQNGIAFNKL